jgi:hypothetical protein
VKTHHIDVLRVLLDTAGLTDTPVTVYVDTVTDPHTGSVVRRVTHFSEHCTAVDTDNSTRAAADDTAGAALRRYKQRNGLAVGCRRCGGTAVAGRTAVAEFADTIRPDLGALLRSPALTDVSLLLHHHISLTSTAGYRGANHLTLDGAAITAAATAARTVTADTPDISDDITNWVAGMCDTVNDAVAGGHVDTLRRQAATHIVHRAWQAAHTVRNRHNNSSDDNPGTAPIYVGLRTWTHRERTDALDIAYGVACADNNRILALPVKLAGWAISTLYSGLHATADTLETLNIPTHLTLDTAAGTVICELAAHTTWANAIATVTALHTTVGTHDTPDIS